MTLPLVIVAALADNHVIGADNRLLWRLKSDLKRFREITLGRPMVMGRKTFESIGKPLPGRYTVVLTRDPAFAHDGVTVTHTLADALAAAQHLGTQHGADSVIIAGGGDVYAQSMGLADRLRLTQVHATPAGDAHFPHIDWPQWRETFRERHPAGPDDEHPFTFIDLIRR